MQTISDLKVPASYLAAFIEDLDLGATEQDELVRRAGLKTGQLAGGEAWLGLTQLLAAMRIVDASSTPGWHIEPALNLEAAHHGPLGIAVVTASTVRQAIATLVQFEPTRAPWTLLQAREKNQQLELRAVPVIALEAPGQVLMEMNLIALAGLLAQLLGQQARQLQIRFPTNYRAWEQRLCERLPGQVDFSGRDYRISLPQSLLDRPCLMADASLHASAVARCKSLMLQHGRQGPLTTRLRQRLFELEGRSPGQARLASELGLSTRSLIRQLADEGSSFREQLDQVRQTLARDLLLHSEMSIATIAENLGYADPANFGRAFHRWFGHSPGRLRSGPKRD